MHRRTGRDFSRKCFGLGPLSVFRFTTGMTTITDFPKLQIFGPLLTGGAQQTFLVLCPIRLRIAPDAVVEKIELSFDNAEVVRVRRNALSVGHRRGVPTSEFRQILV